MYEHNALGYWSGLALCLTKVRSSRARCPATALILIEMILYVPVNSYGHIGTLPPFYGYGTSVHPETASNLTILVNH